MKAELVGGPWDGLVVDTTSDGPAVIELGDVEARQTYRRAGRVEGRWVYQWQGEAG